MIFKKEIRKPILALLFLSLGGWLLHFRIHPVSNNPSNFVPFVLGLVNIIITPLLFNRKKTVIIAYLINGLGVIIGGIIMAHFSFSVLPKPLTFTNIIFKTALGDIFILFSKLFIGQTILLHFYPTGLGRMFTPSWWVRHFFYLTIAYSLGHFLWK
jgi:membrane-bound ClpP family serine protease